MIEQACRRGIRETLGCVMPPCVFSDVEFGFLARVGALPGRCLPYPGVLNGLRVYHCRALMAEAEKRLGEFSDLAGIKRHFFRKYAAKQVKTSLFRECGQCFSRGVGVCVGGCMCLK